MESCAHGAACPLAWAMPRSAECNVITFTEAGLWPVRGFAQPAPTLPRYLKFGARALGLISMPHCRAPYSSSKIMGTIISPTTIPL
jgi:hypothetical protein